jgi:6-phosphogluconolactonase (cycloisomerase 2 family)
MKFSNLRQLFLASRLFFISVAGLLVATLLTACQLVTVDFVFVANSSGSSAGSAGEISVFAVDAQSGAIRVAAPNVSSGGVGPVAMAVTSDYNNLYVANAPNANSGSLVHFTIAQTGVVTQKDSVNMTSAPVSIAVNATGTYLYVVSGTTSATLTEYALSSGTIGSIVSQVNLTIPGFGSDSVIPTGVNVLINNATNLSTTNGVYVTAYDANAYNPGGAVTSSANPGWVYGFTVGSSGALSPASGSPYKAGVKPSALTSDPTNRFLYVTDFASNELIGYTIQTNSALDFLLNGPFKTGNEPSAIQIDPRGLYIYITNSLDSTISAFAIQLSTGTPSIISNVTGNASNGTDTDPVAVVIDPGLGRYVYTANHIGDSVSGFGLTPNTGALAGLQASPYPTGANPTAIVCVPHGDHAVQQVTP